MIASRAAGQYAPQPADRQLRSSWLEVRLDQISANMDMIRRRLPRGCRFIAVLKADAYGHGLLPVAARLAADGADGFAVGGLEEAIELRQAGITAPILALVPPLPEDVPLAAQYGIAVTAGDLDWLKQAMYVWQAWRSAPTTDSPYSFMSCTSVGAGDAVLPTLVEAGSPSIRFSNEADGPSPYSADKATCLNNGCMADDQPDRPHLRFSAGGSDWPSPLSSGAKRSLPQNVCLRLHVKIDTGMGRIGLRGTEECAEAIRLTRLDGVVLEGIYTHLATANQADERFYRLQRQRFAAIRQLLLRCKLPDVMVHCANSAAAIRFPSTAALDAVRVGASLFGIETWDADAQPAPPVQLLPTLSWHVRLLQVKKVQPGERIGYDNSYLAESEEWIGTVPVGYADGYVRGFAPGEVLVGGQRAPIAGRVCMNQMMIRLPAYMPPGTIVTLLGQQGNRSIGLAELAERIETIPQQVLTQLSSRLPRFYAGEA